MGVNQITTRKRTDPANGINEFVPQPGQISGNWNGGRRNNRRHRCGRRWRGGCGGRRDDSFRRGGSGGGSGSKGFCWCGVGGGGRGGAALAVAFGLLPTNRLKR